MEQLQNIFCEVEEYLKTHYRCDDNGNVGQKEELILFKSSVPPIAAECSMNVESEILHRLLLLASPGLLAEMLKLFDPGTEERRFLENKAAAIREKTGQNFCTAFDSDEMIDTVGNALDYSLSEMSFYETLVLFIVESGYRKVSDFYNRIGIDHRYWHRYKKGFIPPKKRLMEIIFFLELEYEDAEYLMNVAGYVFQRNNVTDVIVMYFLKNGYSKKMPPEELLILVDQVLINFNQAPIHSDES